MVRVLEKANFPAVSAPSAMRSFPNVRNRERNVWRLVYGHARKRG